MPPSICTRNWRLPVTRQVASRTTEYASGSRSSSVSPFLRRSRNSTVLPRSCSSVSALCSSSNESILSTILFRRLISPADGSNNLLKKLMLSSNARPGFGLSPNEKLHIAAQFIIVASLRGFINLFMAKMARAGGKLRHRAPCGAEPPKIPPAANFFFSAAFLSRSALKQNTANSILPSFRLVV